MLTLDSGSRQLKRPCQEWHLTESLLHLRFLIIYKRSIAKKTFGVNISQNKCEKVHILPQ
jgi:hypothetical protein